MKIVFVASYYDKPLQGLCRVNGKLCEFTSEWESDDYVVIPLSMLQKIKWVLRKFLFEICVGRHWTYVDGRRVRHFYWRTPKWLHKILFMAFYHKFYLSKWKDIVRSFNQLG